MTTSPIVIALDYHDINCALRFVDQINPDMCRLKIGKEMFTLFGPSIVKILHQRGFEIFLDLKFYDIPTTTANAVAAAADLGVWMINVHASGGKRMMIAAREKLNEFGKNPPLLIAVTVLTSMNEIDLKELGITLTPFKQAEYLAKLTHECKLDGVVCSPQEASHFKKEIDKNFILVSPGIRPHNSDAIDQRRIMTPLQAKQSKVDYLVIGRPITQSLKPAKMLQQILSSLKQ
ncbi:orotidine-5'-phosphate decarboxylase [Pantoea sp. Mhis]|uniref:orotidine-5'-phosphate decarboxylase n=1 Tax=Pantoea sp. Mhis TaxID=2576759 RepID=UPI00135ABBAC|nr:orotidine-5'-phosphate decarboxylase [Pantoea sp. Mhis]MXP56196.1 orotidine-5'-phosphate decarboxylase [Pantoea sp. Mhis]